MFGIPVSLAAQAGTRSQKGSIFLTHPLTEDVGLKKLVPGVGQQLLLRRRTSNSSRNLLGWVG